MTTRGVASGSAFSALLLAVGSSLAQPSAVAKTPVAPQNEGPPPRGVSAPGKSPWDVIRPSILGEADYRVYPSDAEGLTGFAIARFRPGIVFTPAPWFQAVGAAEFAGEYPIILDLYARMRTGDLEFTLGYSKPPLFASFVYEPVHALPTPDRAAVVNSFRIRRDVGADLHYSPRALPIEGWLRVGNGSGSPLGNDTAAPAGYGMLDLVLGRANRHTKEHTLGLRAGLGAVVESVSDRDGIAGQTPLGFVYFRPVVVSGLRSVAEAHLVGYAGPLRFTTEAAMSREGRSRDDDGNPDTARVVLPSVWSYGLTGEAAWTICGQPRAVGSAPTGTATKAGDWDGGAVELAARYDGMWLGRGASDVDEGGSQGGVLSLKWWAWDFVSATLAGYALHYDDAPIEEPGVSWSYGGTLRLSFYFGLPGARM